MAVSRYAQQLGLDIEYNDDTQYDPIVHTITYSLAKNINYPSLYTAIKKDLYWYNTRELVEFDIYMEMKDDSNATHKLLEDVINTYRITKVPHKRDPQFIVYTSICCVDERLLDLIEKKDIRMPRIILLIEHRDDEDFGNCQKDLLKAARMLAQREICFRIFFLVESSYHNLAILHQQLRHMTKDECLSKIVFNDFPTIEVPLGISSLEPEILADYLTALWTEFPQLNESIHFSRGGYFKKFFITKELWYLSTILKNKPLAARAKDDNNILQEYYEYIKKQGNEYLDQFVRTILARYMNLDCYYRWQFKKSNSVLEFDYDSISDSYECQSPVFINDRWVLREQY